MAMFLLVSCFALVASALGECLVVYLQMMHLRV